MTRVRCGVLFTPPVAYEGIVISCQRKSCHFFFEEKNHIYVLPIFEKSTMFDDPRQSVEDEAGVKTTNSIAIDFPILGRPRVLMAG